MYFPKGVFSLPGKLPQWDSLLLAQRLDICQEPVTMCGAICKDGHAQSVPICSCCSSYEKMESILLPLNLGWPWD